MYTTVYPTGIPSRTGLPVWVDNVDDVEALVVNDPVTELLACLNELGTLPSGSTADLTTRLAVSLNDDGSLKSTLSPTFASLAVSGTIALTSGLITAAGDITLDPAGHDVILDNSHLQLQSTYSIKHRGDANHYTELFSDSANDGWYWDETNQILHFHLSGNDKFFLRSTAIYTYVYIQALAGVIIGAESYDNMIDDSVPGGASASTPLYIGTKKILVEDGSYTLLALKIGDGVTNYCEIKADGEINLHGTARVTRHIYFSPASFKFPGANPAGESQTDLFHTLDFDDGANDESAYAERTIPFRWASGTDVTIIISWFYTGAQDNGFVVWGIEYKGIKAGEAVAGAGTSITQKSAGTHTTGLLVRTTFATKILGSNLEADDDLGLRVYRHSSDGVNDTLAKDAKLVNVHISFTMDKLGQAT